MTCAQMGGPATCAAVVVGNTPDEMIANGMKHLQEVHPDMAEGMKTMSKEATDKWTAEFQAKWAGIPDSQ